MKKYSIVILLLLLVVTVHAIDRVKFVRSKPFSLIVFARAAGGDVHLSYTLAKYIRTHISRSDSAKFYRIVRNFNSLNLETSYVFTEYPEQRQRPKSTGSLIYNAAIRSKSMEDFYINIAGILPIEQWLKLQKTLDAIEPYYNKMMQQHEPQMEEQLAAIQQYTKQAGEIFYKTRKFYGSCWSEDVPFIVSMYTIPGDVGNTTASPYSNTLALGVLTGERDYAVCVCPALHEMCHVLYETQTLKLQLKIDSIFRKSTTPFAAFAYNYFDEALATASANGWAYKELNGFTDTNKWYDNRYINGYGKAIYPLVKTYIEAGREIDRAFVNKAIAIFEETFPKAAYEYAILLNNVEILTDAQNHSEYAAACMGVAQHFQITKSNGYYPLVEEGVKEHVEGLQGTLLFIVHSHHEKNYKQLATVFPQVGELDPDQEGIASFYDKKKRAIIIINTKNVDNIEKAAAQMERMQYIDKKKLFTPLL